MATPWQRPELWRLKSTQLALKKTIEASRQLLITVQFEWLEREFQELDQLSARLAREAADLQATSSPDSERTRTLADGWCSITNVMERCNAALMLNNRRTIWR